MYLLEVCARPPPPVIVMINKTASQGTGVVNAYDADMNMYCLSTASTTSSIVNLHIYTFGLC
jgi:hypothetical protein